MWYSEKNSRTVQQLAHGLASSEWARPVTDWRRERRRETAELKGRQRQQREGRLQLHSWLSDGMQVCTFESLEFEGSYVGDLHILYNTGSVVNIFYNNYKWSIAFKNYVSLSCTPETYIMLYTNYLNFKKKKICKLKSYLFTALFPKNGDFPPPHTQKERKDTTFPAL